MFKLVISSLNLHQEFQWPQRTMVACPRQHSMAAPFLSTPLSPVTGDLKIYYYHNFLAKTVVRNPDHFEDALRRLTTSTVPPSITTTHHDGTLSSSLAYTLTNDDYPLPSAPIQCSRQHLREMHRFQNAAWTKWDAVQFMDELEANRVTDKADSESWKKWERTHNCRLSHTHQRFWWEGAWRKLSALQEVPGIEQVKINNVNDAHHVNRMKVIDSYKRRHFVNIQQFAAGTYSISSYLFLKLVFQRFSTGSSS